MIAGPICCAISFSASCRARSRPARPSKTTGAAASSGSSTISTRRTSRPQGNGGNGHAAATVADLPDVAEMSDAELLAGEKKALGFYMSSHPLARHAGLLQALATHRVADLPSLPEKTEVILGGMITNVKERTSRRAGRGSPGWPSSPSRT